MLKQVLLVLSCCALVTVRGQNPCLGAPTYTHSFAASAESCNHYVICMDGQTIHGQRCPDNFPDFEPTSQSCEISAACTNCSPFGVQNLPHPDNCSQFIECIMGTREIRECPEGLLFDRTVGNCNLAHNVYCPGEPVTPDPNPTYPTPDPTDTTLDPWPPTPTTEDPWPPTTIDPWPPTPTPPPGGDLPVCSPVGGQIHHAHPTDCTRFFMCINGMLIPRQCESGLHWNQLRTVCDLPESANCLVGPTTQTPPPFPVDPPVTDPPLNPPPEETQIPLEEPIQEDENQPEYIDQQVD